MGELSKFELAERAAVSYLRDGKSYSQIGQELDLDRRTVKKYVAEALAANSNADDRELARNVSLAKLEWVQEKAKELLDSGEIKPSSLSNAQLLRQFTEAIKEQNKITGLHVSQVHQIHDVGPTIYDLWQQMNDTADDKTLNDPMWAVGLSEEEIQEALDS